MKPFKIFFRNQLLAWELATNKPQKIKDPKLYALKEKTTNEYFKVLNNDSALVTKLPLIIGRYDVNTAVTDLPNFPLHKYYAHVSRKHAIIYEKEGKLRIKNVSRHGTFLASTKEKISDREIEDGDTFYLGKTNEETFVMTIKLKECSMSADVFYP